MFCIRVPYVLSCCLNCQGCSSLKHIVPPYIYAGELLHLFFSAIFRINLPVINVRRKERQIQSAWVFGGAGPRGPPGPGYPGWPDGGGPLAVVTGGPPGGPVPSGRLPCAAMATWGGRAWDLAKMR